MKTNKEYTREIALLEALDEALIIIAGEYPKEDERYQFAIHTAKKFNLDIGEDDDGT
jgi:hypothetical protein